MKRFMTAWIINESVEKLVAFAEGEDWQSIKESCDEFVWQFAPDKETAIKQHDAKFIAWRQDVNSGREQLDTY